MSKNGKLPRWDMTVVFPSLKSEEFEKAYQQLISDVEQLANLLNNNEIDRQPDVAVNNHTVAIFDEIIGRFNDIYAQSLTTNAYLLSFMTTDSRNDVAQARYSQLQPAMARLSLLGTRLTAWIGSMDVEALIAASQVARDHAYIVRRAQREAKHLMSPKEEALASELNLTGSQSWIQMFNTFSSRITVDVEIDGEMETMPLTAAQNLTYERDRDLRQRAHTAVLAALEKAAVPLAAALNAIKGETITLSQRRGWASPLDEVLFNNAIDRETLDAMMTATQAAFPDFQRYLKARARALGLPVLHWYDRYVPLGESSQSWDYADGTQFVLEQFGTYSDKLRCLAERAFAENWIDAEPRHGKRGGAFCMGIGGGDSRILANYEPAFSGVGTLAHELGHAYHNLNLAERPSFLQQTPMTLAETASTFCQKIVENAALKKADEQDQLIILDGLLEYAARVVLGASSNFLFEQKLFERRAERDLSVEELCALDVETQQIGTGDAVDPDHLHPYRWAYVPHYYIDTYYNFPYTFGLLFGLGLYAQYQQAPETFQAGYDDLLSSTGMGEAAELAARFGIDIREPAFWEASLDVLRHDIDRFEALVDKLYVK